MGATRKKEQVIPEEIQTLNEPVTSDPKLADAPTYTSDEIQARIKQLKADAETGDRAEKAKALLAQLPKGKTASELGVSAIDYGIKVLSNQSSDSNVVQPMLAVARVDKALKTQGYSLEQREDVKNQLEAMYGI